MAERRWLPLESNPEVLNKYITFLGVAKSWNFVDIWSLDPDMLNYVPRPVYAVLLLYPLTKKTQEHQLGQQTCGSSDLYFMKQTISNACGTVGVLHALCNNVKKLSLEGDKPLIKFYESTAYLSPIERSIVLESHEGLAAIHEMIAMEGQTQTPSRDEKLDLHFIAFVHNSGVLYELDGRMDYPISHGKTTEDTLLEDTANVIQKFIQREPENLNFTLMALVKVFD